MSPRALRMLAEVDRVACEDTRVTRRLLTALDIEGVKLTRLDAHTERSAAPELLAALSEGASVALVSDAGTPGISDPGAHLVASARAAQLRVEAIPGPSALTTALSASGLPGIPMTFHGFAPKKAKARRDAWSSLGAGTHAWFVPARDIGGALKTLAATQPNATVVVARELTKRHETWSRGTASDLDALWPPSPQSVKGEAVLMAHIEARIQEVDDGAILDALAQARTEGMRSKDAASAVAERLGVSRRRVYQLGLARPEPSQG